MTLDLVFVRRLLARIVPPRLFRGEPASLSLDLVFVWLLGGLVLHGLLRSEVDVAY